MLSRVLKSLIVPLLALLVVLPATTQAADSRPQWLQDAQKPWKYPQIHMSRDVKIWMSDGQVLAADLFLPADANGKPISEKLPTVLTITPYNKNIGTLLDATLNDPQVKANVMPAIDGALKKAGAPFDGLEELLGAVSGGMLDAFALPRKLVQNGYAVLMVDARGTGSSSGHWNALDTREQKDSVEIIDWIRKQGFSNGNVGMGGVSYSGINAVQAASKRPEGLKAIFPIVPSEDLPHEVVGPGGALGAGFMPVWLFLVNMMKNVPPVDAFNSTSTLDKWAQDRQKGWSLFTDGLFPAFECGVKCSDAASAGPFYDERNPGAPGLIEKINIPTFVVGGWHDIFTHGEPRIFNRLKLPMGQKQLLMGDWYHVTTSRGMGQADAPPRMDDLMLAWYDRWLKNGPSGIEKQAPVHLYQQGGGWKAASNYPRPGVKHQRLHLNAAKSGSIEQTIFDGSLVPVAKEQKAMKRLAKKIRKLRAQGLTKAEAKKVKKLKKGIRTPAAKVVPSVTYDSAAAQPEQTVDVQPNYNHSFCSRSAAAGTMGLAAIFGQSCTRDNRIVERGAATFTTAPFQNETSVSGPVGAKFTVIPDKREMFVVAQLSDVYPDGHDVELTETELLLSRRSVDRSRSTVAENGDYVDPFHPASKNDLLPVEPGKPTELLLGLNATEFVLKPGHRLRLSIMTANMPKSLPLGPDLLNSEYRGGQIVVGGTSPGYLTIPFVNESR